MTQVMQCFGIKDKRWELVNTVGSTKRYSNVTQISVRQFFFLDNVTQWAVRGGIG